MKPSEYLKIKYSAPTGACKCGGCQLVPVEVLRRWAQQIEGPMPPTEQEVDAAASAIDNIYFVPGVPYGWAKQAAELALTAAAMARAGAE